MALFVNWQPLVNSLIQPNTGPRVCVQLLVGNDQGFDVNDVDISQSPPPGVTNVEWEVTQNDDVTPALPVGPQAGPIALANLTFDGSAPPGITSSILRIRVCYNLPTFPDNTGLHAVTPDNIHVVGDDGTDEADSFGWTVDTDPLVNYCGRWYLRSQTVFVQLKDGSLAGGYRRPANDNTPVQPD